MSAAEEALTALAAVSARVAAASSSVSHASPALDDVTGLLGGAFGGSTSPAAESALESLAEAARRLSSAEKLLGTCAADVRAYVAEAFGTMLPGASDPSPRRRAPDPTRPGALGTAFQQGVHDPDVRFLPKEREIAERLAEEHGACLYPRVADHTRQRQKNPDAIVRRTPDDPGTVTEFKTLERNDKASDRTVQRNITTAGSQLHQHGGGDVVIDARATSIDVGTARQGYARALGEHRQRGAPLPRRVWVIFGSGEMIDVSERT